MFTKPHSHAPRVPTAMTENTHSLTTTTTPTTRSLVRPTQRPPLARRAHIGTSRPRPWLKILNRPTKLLERILLNLSLEDLIISMHVSKTWLFIASNSPRIRERLYWWHVNRIFDSRPSTPRSTASSIPIPRGYELFHMGLSQGILIAYRTPRRGEFFVLMNNHDPERKLSLLDSKRTKIHLDCSTGRFTVQFPDHANKPLLSCTLSPGKVSRKSTKISGDRLFSYFKEYHSPADMDWEFLLQSRVAQTRRERMKRLVKPLRLVLSELSLRVSPRD